MWTRETIASKLATNDKWLFRGILALYKRQTQDEQFTYMTRWHNGKGFNSADARLLSGFARQILAWQAHPGHWDYPLSEKQLFWARATMHKYAGQLAEIANARETVNT